MGFPYGHKEDQSIWESGGVSPPSCSGLEHRHFLTAAVSFDDLGEGTEGLRDVEEEPTLLLELDLSL